MSDKPLCIGFGKRENRCLNDAGSSHSQLWCQECDDARRKHISQCKENREPGGGGPSLDPDGMPPEELARLRAEGFGHMIGKRRIDDSPG